MLGFSQSEKNKRLHEAIEAGDPEKAKKALQAGADPDKTFEAGVYVNAPIFHALRQGQEAIVGALVDAGAHLHSVDSNDYHGGRPLHMAAYYGRSGSFHYIMQKTALLQTSYGLTPLHYALQGGHYTFAREIMNMPGMLDSLVVPEGATLLHYALRKNPPVDILADLMKMLDEKQLNSCSKEYGTAINMAIGGNDAAFDFFLSSGMFNLNAEDNYKRNALCAAVYHNKPEILKKLLAAGADFSAENYYNQNALEFAAANGGEPCMNVLLDFMKARGAVPKIGMALCTAALRGEVGLIKLLVAAGADPDFRNPSGTTPLMLAAEKGNLESVQYLARNCGANLALFNEKGQTAIDLSRGSSVRDFLMNCRMFAAPKAAETAPKPLDNNNGMFVKTGDYTIDVTQGGLTMTFNFWTRSIAWRDPANPQAPLVLQSFSEVERQEAIEEAQAQLKEQGGAPPETRGFTIKKTLG